ncbi:ABC transporter permease [Hasllibacter sp. MH4015]|uniref:ABC transporter permease n=1 Tax=Hasllibacter sp. MH4015 TaxID=2854029 RepID=UPI001CD7EA27|nr:ABC transporter permease [Hasllibacter sp. MH4015]
MSHPIDQPIPTPLPEQDPEPGGPKLRGTGRKSGWLSPLNQRRWRNFKANRRAYRSFWIFLVLYGLSLLAPLLANDRPLLVQFQGEYYTPMLNFYPETQFGGDFRAEAVYRDVEVQCLIISGGLDACWDDPEDVIEQVQSTGQYAGTDVEEGWLIWPPIPYAYDTIVDRPGTAPGAPNVINTWFVPADDPDGAPVFDLPRSADPEDWDRRFGLLPEEIRGANLLGTDDTSRDVLSRVIYGFELSVSFALIVTVLASAIGIFAGAIQGFFGGWVDLIFQRIIEIWNATPSLYVIIIVATIFAMDFWLLVFLMVAFGWTGLVGVVRAEFLRARNFEYVRAARALGVGSMTIMFRHVLPNAMVATLTFLPFIVTGTIGGLASLDFLGFGLPSSEPSLGEMTLQAKNNLTAPWLGFTAFFTFAIMLSLLVFVFEGIRDAFDPRKTFA